jgi:spore maturation protein CgeB
MNIVIFGLTISSAWGNGHATLWRGLCRALHRRGHSVRFFERDVPYYAQHRDLESPDGCTLTLYSDWSGVAMVAEEALRAADVALVSSYCPDGRPAARAVLGSRAGVKVFYDLDTPVTLSRVQRGEDVEYLPVGGLADFDLVLSFTGGPALDELRRWLGARQVEALYGSVDPDRHHPVAPSPHLRSDLSYLGTYAADRQAALEELFVVPARRRLDLRFLLAGAQYPAGFPWTPNIFHMAHMPPAEHPAFFCSSGLTLNVTRKAMADMGYCPSGRLFEAAACGTAMISDWWPGLDEFFEPGRDVLIATAADDALAALELGDAERARIARSARERTLDCHSAAVRAAQLESMLIAAAARRWPESAIARQAAAGGH